MTSCQGCSEGGGPFSYRPLRGSIRRSMLQVGRGNGRRWGEAVVALLVVPNTFNVFSIGLASIKLFTSMYPEQAMSLR